MTTVKRQHMKNKQVETLTETECNFKAKSNVVSFDKLPMYVRSFLEEATKVKN